jgi:hypothetical protein
MGIISSSYTEGHAQVDGRHYITEIHVDSDGKQHQIEYLANSGYDYDAKMNARAAILSEQLAEAEFESIMDEV